jgi:hypothetical protein
LTSATIRTDETGEPIARAGESAETCHISQRLLSTFECVQADVGARFLYGIDTHTRPARFLGVRVPSPAYRSNSRSYVDKTCSLENLSDGLLARCHRLEVTLNSAGGSFYVCWFIRDFVRQLKYNTLYGCNMLLSF